MGPRITQFKSDAEDLGICINGKGASVQCRTRCTLAFLRMHDFYWKVNTDDAWMWKSSSPLSIFPTS